MKLASSVEKLAIVGMSEGEQIASVKELLIGRSTKGIEYLSVTVDGKDVLPGVVSFKDVTGVGNDFIIIPSANSIENVYSNNKLITALEDCISLKGKTVLASCGDILGVITDFGVNTKTGVIDHILLDNDQSIEGRKLVTLSSKFVVVNAQNAESAKQPVDDATMSYLVGKTVTEDVTSEDGSFVISQGTVLTEELISEAETYQMLVQLTMAV